MAVNIINAKLVVCRRKTLRNAIIFKKSVYIMFVVKEWWFVRQIFGDFFVDVVVFVAK